MKKFFEFLRKHTMKKINYKKKKMKFIAKSSRNHMKIQKSVIFVQKNFRINIWKYSFKIIKSHFMGENRGVAYSICNLKYIVAKWIAIAFHNGFNCDDQFMIKKLKEELKKTIYLFRRKYWKIHNLYSFNRKRGYKNW